MILMTGCYNMQAPDGSMIFEGLKGVEAGPVYTQAAIDQLMPGWGGPFIAITIFFFAFTTILGYYYMAETNMAYLNRYIRKPVLMSACKAIFIGTVAFGAINSSTLIWTMADVGVGTMAWLNLIAIMLLQKPPSLRLRTTSASLRTGSIPCSIPSSSALPMRPTGKQSRRRQSGRGGRVWCGQLDRAGPQEPGLSLRRMLLY